MLDDFSLPLSSIDSSLVDTCLSSSKEESGREARKIGRWNGAVPLLRELSCSIGARKRSEEREGEKDETKAKTKKKKKKKKKEREKKNVGRRSYVVGHWLPQLMLSISSWPTCVAVIVLANHADFNIILPRATERERESSFDIAISLSRSTASYSSETTSERKKKIQFLKIPYQIYLFIYSHPPVFQKERSISRRGGKK